MQRLEVSGAVRPIYGSLGVKQLMAHYQLVIDLFENILLWRKKNVYVGIILNKFQISEYY